MLLKLPYILCIIRTVLGQTEDDIFPAMPVIPRKSGNALCERHCEEYLDNLKNFTLWAHEMRDASAKSTTGVLRGSIYNMGDFSQCLTSRAPFSTQYCLATIKANVPYPKTKRDPFSLQFDPNDQLIDKLYRYKDISKQSRNVVKMGWCIPASCSSVSTEKYLNEYFRNMDYPLRKYNVTYTAEVPQILCSSSNNQTDMDGYDIAFCLLSAILILLVAISTSWEYNQKVDKSVARSSPYKMFLAFSARKNIQDLNKFENQDAALSSLYGIKTFAIFMVILDHRFGIFAAGAVSNFDFIEGLYRNIIVSYIFHGDLFVDTFFVISGLLAVYNLLNLFDKKYMNPGFIIFMRFMRLTPAYAFVLFFATTILYYTGNGALWNAVVGSEVRDCRQNWWTNLLYISNYINEKNMCMPHSWYLPCDFHYFIIAVGLIILIRKEKLYGLVALSVLTLISIIIPFVIILINERPAFLRFYIDFLETTKAHPDYVLTYIKSHARATPYFVGMFAGYVYYRMKGSGRILSEWYTAILLFISLFILTTCMYSGVIFYDPYHKYNALESAIYGSLHRSMWALGTFGMIYAISHGTCGFAHKFLSSKFWVPLSKLVYGAYLWHLSFQHRSLAKANSPQVFNFFDVGLYGLGDIGLSFSLALALHLTIEAPVKGILREIFSTTKADQKKANPVVETQISNEDSKL